LQLAEQLLRQANAVDQTLNPINAFEDKIALGDLQSRKGDLAFAKIWYARAYEQASQLSSQAAKQRAQNAIGLIEWYEGQYQESAKTLLSASQSSSEALDETLNDLALAWRSLGNYAAASESLKRSQQEAHRLHHTNVEAAAVANLGVVYHDMGLYQTAIYTDKKALDLLKALKDVDGTATVRCNIGYSEFMLGHQAEARSFLLASYNEGRSQRSTVLMQAVLSNLGRLDAETGQYAEAKIEINKAFRFARATKDKAGQGICLTDLGLLSLKRNAAPSALAHTYKAWILLRSVGDPALTARAESVLMDASHQSGNNDSAIFWGKQAVARYEGMRIGLNDAGIFFCQAHSQTYRTLASILIDEGRIDEAIHVLRLLKGEEVDEFDRDGRAIVRGDKPPVRGGKVLVRGERPPVRDGAVLVRGNRPPVRGGGDLKVFAQNVTPVFPVDVDLTPQERRAMKLCEASKNIGDLREAIGWSFESNHKRTGENSFPRHSDMPRKMGTAYIWTLVTPNQVRVVVATRNRTVVTVSRISEAMLNRAIFEFREKLNDPSSDVRAISQKLYDILLSHNVSDMLTQEKVTKIVWSLDGVLRYIPVAALYDGKSFLVERWASDLISPVLTQRGDHSGIGTLAMGVSKAHVVIDSARNRTIMFSALPSVSGELTSVCNFDSVRSKKLIDEQFTLASARQALLQRYGIVHIATHCHIDQGDASISCMLLGDGTLMTAADMGRIPELFRGVKLLSFSGCETGYMQSESDGKEIDGFTGVALRDGADSVLATLWVVQDNSTKEVMDYIYIGVKKDELLAPEALRKAQITMLRGTGMASRLSHPYYWAPFIVFD
jgi:CHAT domain-containing protein/tetratricopeptide (TPR) repeat protein